MKKNLIITLFIFSTVACTQKKTNTQNNDKKKIIQKVESGKDKQLLKIFYPSDDNIEKAYNEDTLCSHLDESINGTIIFNDGGSILKSFENIKNVWGRNDRIYFTTIDSSIYISLGLNYGGGPNEYKEAKIGYIIGGVDKFIPEEILNSSFNPRTDSLLPKFYFTRSDFQNFISGYGIKLGISEEELIDITLSNGCELIKKEEENRTIYVYENEYCVYEANYVFENNKLIQFSFGYITP